jgi:hypothetical protein
MTSKEFVIWLKGFTEGVHDFNITPKQWDLLKKKLAEVSDEPRIVNSPPYPFGVPNGTFIPSPAITTTPGSTSITFTTGSNVTYTTNGAPNWYTTYFADLNDKTND